MNPRVTLVLACLGLGACTQGTASSSDSGNVTSVPVTSMPGHDQVGQDTTPKEAPRLVAPEVYLRTYLNLFGGLAPLDAQVRLRGTNTSVFDTFDDYLSAIGMPDYRNEIPRATQTNTLMLATFERLGVALCDRAIEHDLKGTPPPIAQRLIYAFDLPTGEPDLAAFTTRFDVLHRTFLGYPVAMAPADRTARFFALYQGTVMRHSAHGAPTSMFSPDQAGWASVCYGLVRHPEFHLY